MKKKNKYPLPNKSVLYNKKKCIQPTPEVGKRYHCFDDGKITFSRHYIIKVTEVLGYMGFKKKYPQQFKRYIETAKTHYWLFSRRSDKFIISDKGEHDELGVYVRTKDGGWFGIGSWWNSGELDVTGKFWEYLVKHIDNFDYTEEEKEQLIKDGTICD